MNKRQTPRFYSRMLLDFLRRLKHNRPKSSMDPQVQNSLGECASNVIQYSSIAAILLETGPSGQSGGFFNNAINATIKHSTMIDVQSAHFHQTVFHTIDTGTASMSPLHFCPQILMDLEQPWNGFFLTPVQRLRWTRAPVTPLPDAIQEHASGSKRHWNSG